MRKGNNIRRSDVNTLVRMFSSGKGSMRSIIAVLMLGIGIGVAYEEFVGIGTWHSFHAKTDNFNVCFTPPSGCGDLIAVQISKAKKNVFVQAYGLTKGSIIYQLKEAKKRGVQVSVLLDGGNLSDNDSIYHELQKAGIKVGIDKMPGIAHNKVIIIDEQKVITGSFNFTNAADTKNAENVLLIEDKKIAAKYLGNWYARSKVKSQVNRISHTMRLEDQELESQEIAEQIEILTEEMLKNNIKKIWDK